ncbi:hypothetical protein [Embleya hyalina]|uniref:hypothetical protein n=1 Tax=Embleya hyalina TaxID=516124 RepID=UPI001C3F5645|nr:hypothetical protein [Embleya hyalina]
MNDPPGRDLPAGTSAETVEHHHRALVREWFVAFARAHPTGLDAPGGGATRQRWDTLADPAEHDLALGRLAEGHADALAIIAEAETGVVPVPPGARWGYGRPSRPAAGSRRNASMVADGACTVLDGGVGAPASVRTRW